MGFGVCAKKRNGVILIRADLYSICISSLLLVSICACHLINAWIVIYEQPAASVLSASTVQMTSDAVYILIAPFSAHGRHFLSSHGTRGVFNGIMTVPWVSVRSRVRLLDLESTFNRQASSCLLLHLWRWWPP